MNPAARFRLIHIVVRKFVFAATAASALLCSSTSVNASNTEAQTSLDIRIENPIGTYVYIASIKNLPYTFVLKMQSDVGVCPSGAHRHGCI